MPYLFALAALVSVGLVPATGCAASPAPSTPPVVATTVQSDKVDVPSELSELAIALPSAVSAHLQARRWDAAAEALTVVKVPPAQQADLAFVKAWVLVQAQRAPEAAELLPHFESTNAAPAAYVELIRGEILRSQGASERALVPLEAVPSDSLAWGSAQVGRAAALVALGRQADARVVLERAAARPDPAPGGDRVLAALIALDESTASALRRRLWREYPGTPAEVAVRGQPMPAATWRDAARRAEIRSGASDHAGAVADLAPFVSAVDDLTSRDACRFRYVHGRALYRQNQLTNAVTAFGDVGARCAGGEGADYGARSLYLLGTAEFRRKQYASSASAFRRLASDYSDHSMADDGLLHGGISLQESGDLAGAQVLWRQALEGHPTGDTAPESSWRLAWSLYLQGKPAEAIRTAEALGALPPAADALHVAAGRYWAARWQLYPNVSDPRTPTTDPARREAALSGWEGLCRDLPHSFYAIQAWSRLQALAPERAAQLAARPSGHSTGEVALPWVVRRSFFEDPAVRDGVALARVGLGADAQVAWDSAAIPAAERSAEEVAWLARLRAATGDWLRVHDELRAWLKTHAIPSLGPRAAQIVRLVYPDRYLSEVRAAFTPEYRVPMRLFHALCREESNFNVAIVSHAGAIGLSQLMPATAAQTAGWLGLKVTNAQLSDPALNARIGAKYLDTVYRQHDGSPYLALAAYNAGGGRTRQWRTEWGDVPSDEYVERIPFRETRDYVKRVMGSWQTYRYQFDVNEPSFPDLSGLVDHAWASP